MSSEIIPKIYTTADGRTVIEQSSAATVTLTAEQILVVISQLRACYDYCATWKQPLATDCDRPAASDARPEDSVPRSCETSESGETDRPARNPVQSH